MNSNRLIGGYVTALGSSLGSHPQLHIFSDGSRNQNFPSRFLPSSRLHSTSYMSQGQRNTETGPLSDCGVHHRSLLPLLARPGSARERLRFACMLFSLIEMAVKLERVSFSHRYDPLARWTTMVAGCLPDGG